MNLIYFTEEAYKLLKNDIDNNSDKYSSPERWVTKYFDENGVNEPIVNSEIIVPNISLQNTPIKKGTSREDIFKTLNKDDYMNTITLYGQYKDRISPHIATKYLLWSALCHETFYPYVIKRWSILGNPAEHCFGSKRGRNQLTYANAISRLWWTGYLTYEEDKKSSPWELTQVIFSAQQVQKDLFDQPFSKNRTVVKGLLKALRRIQDKRGDAATNQFRECCNSYLNHYGVITIIDFLTAEEIEEIAYKYMLGNSNL